MVAAEGASRWKRLGEVLVTLIAVAGFVLALIGLRFQQQAARADSAADASGVHVRTDIYSGDDPSSVVVARIENGSRRPLSDVQLVVQENDHEGERQLAQGVPDEIGGCLAYAYQVSLLPPKGKVAQVTLYWTDSSGARWAVETDSSGAKYAPSFTKPSKSFQASATDQPVAYAGGDCKPR